MHFWAKADNARMAARYLSDATSASLSDAATQIGYRSSTMIAVEEAFIRESSLALELIIKAVTATKIEKGRVNITKVKATHRLPELWKEAQLPDLERPEKLHLLQAGIALHWAGRYAAPLNDHTYERDLADVEKLLEVDNRFKRIKIRKPQPMTWDRFDKIYAVAESSFWSLHDHSHPDAFE